MHSNHHFLTPVLASDKDQLSLSLEALEICEKELRDEIYASEQILEQIIDCRVPAAQSVLEAATLRREKLMNQQNTSMCDQCKEIGLFMMSTSCTRMTNSNDCIERIEYQSGEDMEGTTNCIYCGIEFRMASISKKKPSLPPGSTFTLNEVSKVRKYCSSVLDGGSRLKFCEFLSSATENRDLVVQSWSKYSLHYPSNTFPIMSKGFHQEKDRETKNENFEQQALSIAMDQELLATKNIEEVTHSISQWKKYLRAYKTALNGVMEDISRLKKAEEMYLLDRLHKLGMRPENFVQGDQQRQCSICLENKKEIVFQCGHQTCHSCSERIQHCHVCRSEIQQRIRLFD